MAAMVASGELRPPQARAAWNDSEGANGEQSTTTSASTSASTRMGGVSWGMDFSTGDGFPLAHTIGSVGGGGGSNAYPLEDEDEDEALERLAARQSTSALPRTLPSFPDPPLPVPRWTAEEVLIRAPEAGGGNRRAKGGGPTGKVRVSLSCRLILCHYLTHTRSPSYPVCHHHHHHHWRHTGEVCCVRQAQSVQLQANTVRGYRRRTAGYSLRGSAAGAGANAVPAGRPRAFEGQGGEGIMHTRRTGREEEEVMHV